MRKGVATVAQLSSFDEIIDVRTPAEFAEDRIPGAINLPVLDNQQRIIVGTLYKQVSAFEARRVGGAMVAENIARHLAGHLADKPKNWRPLLYCWRGGMRSGSFVTWMRMVGWDACQLEGGYKTYRNHVIDGLNGLTSALRFVVLCGPTGSAKTRVLEALAARGAQVLDLEALAQHKGSVLGAIPGAEQPSQKAFETQLHHAMRGFDAGRPVFVEAESRKIGRIQLPEPLVLAMRAAPCAVLEASRDARLAFLVRDYAYLGDDVGALQARLERLKELQSKETISRWLSLAEAGALPQLFGELMELHYDPLYRRSQASHFSAFTSAPRFITEDLSAAGIARLAEDILATRLGERPGG